MNASIHRTIAAWLAVLVLSGQMFASIPGVCGCSGSEQDGSSCCSTEASDDSNCCCGDRCGVEETECGCGCSDSKSEDEKAPLEENRVSEQLVTGDLPVVVERVAIPRMPRCSAEHQASDLLSVASTQILFCVWQT